MKCSIDKAIVYEFCVLPFWIKSNLAYKFGIDRDYEGITNAKLTADLVEHAHNNKLESKIVECTKKYSRNDIVFEESVEEVCEWDIADSQGVYMNSSCQLDYVHTRKSVEKYNVCPYCTKPIKMKE